MSAWRGNTWAGYTYSSDRDRIFLDCRLTCQHEPGSLAVDNGPVNPIEMQPNTGIYRLTHHECSFLNIWAINFEQII
jgi:hypothetical protein